MTRLLYVWLAVVAASAITLTFAAGTSAHLSWSAPTLYTDGSPIAPGDIDHYTLTWAPAAGQAGPSGSVNVPGTNSTATVNVSCGNTSFTATVTTGANAKYPNATSGPTSGVPYATGLSCTSNPPTGLAVQ